MGRCKTNMQKWGYFYTNSADCELTGRQGSRTIDLLSCDTLAGTYTGSGRDLAEAKKRALNRYWEVVVSQL